MTSLNTEDEKMACASELTVVYQRCAEEKVRDFNFHLHIFTAIFKIQMISDKLVPLVAPKTLI